MQPGCSIDNDHGQRMKGHESSFPSGRKGQRLLLASGVLAMAYGGHFYLVWDTEIHALCGRGHRTPDRNSPFVRWLGVFGERGEARIIGTIELTTAAVLIIGSVIPVASAVGVAMACVTFVLTASFLFSTPGITQISSTGFPIISTLLEQFLLKDIALLAASFTLLLASFSR
jgi:uncharacterized membrane protein YkgB